MRFKEWLIWTEATDAAGFSVGEGVTAYQGPKKIRDLSKIDIPDMTDDQIRLLMKWHGIWDTWGKHDSKTKRERLRIKRANRMLDREPIDPSSAEVANRKLAKLLRGGKQYGKWIKRGGTFPATLTNPREFDH
jgi:hypothetical protein